MVDIQWTRGDKPMPLKVNMDITGSTVAVKVQPLGSRSAPVTTLETTATSETAGEFTVDPSELAAGIYKIEAEVSNLDYVATFPNQERAVLIINPDL